MQVVLQGRACEQQRVREVEAAHGLADERGLVLEHVPFVHHEVAPPRARGELVVHVRALGHLVRGHHHVEIVSASVEGAHETFTLLRIGRVQLDRVERGAEALELGHPA